MLFPELIQTALNDDPDDVNEDVCETTYCGLQDANFNLLAIAGSDGSFAERYEYTPYGQRTVFKESHEGDDPLLTAPILNSQPWEVATVKQPYGICDVGHQGLFFDKEWGAYDNRHRILGSVLARMYQPDPAGYVDGMGLYEMLRTSPLVWRDPFGKETDTTSPWGLGWEWLTGTGPRERHFGQDDLFTKTLREHQHIRQASAEAGTEVETRCAQCNDAEFSRDKNYSLGGIKGVRNYIRDYSTALIPGDRTGNLAVTFLGSYKCRYTVTAIDCCEGMAVIKFHVENRSTLVSATRPALLGYVPGYGRAMEWVNWMAEKGPGFMSETVQTVDWEEQMKFKGNPKCPPRR